jgi:hypothetical protein
LGSSSFNRDGLTIEDNNLNNIGAF